MRPWADGSIGAYAHDTFDVSASMVVAGQNRGVIAFVAGKQAAFGTTVTVSLPPDRVAA